MLVWLFASISVGFFLGAQVASFVAPMLFDYFVFGFMGSWLVYLLALMTHWGS